MVLSTRARTERTAPLNQHAALEKHLLEVQAAADAMARHVAQLRAALSETIAAAHGMTSAARSAGAAAFDAATIASSYSYSSARWDGSERREATAA